MGLASAIWRDDGEAKKKRKKKKCKAPKVKCGKKCCAEGQACLDGQCATPTSPPPPCTPSCGSAVCGDNGCGGSCGTCGSAQSCQGGTCTCPGGQVPCGALCVDACPAGRTINPNTCKCCRVSGFADRVCDSVSRDPCCSGLPCDSISPEATSCPGRTLDQPCSFPAQCAPPLTCNVNLVCS
jgi:hypothetical protein